MWDVDVAVCSPQGFTVLSIADAGLRERLLRIPGLNQSQNHESGALLLFCADNRRHMLIADAAGQPFSPNFESFLIAVIDASLFAERAVAALEAMGYGICYCGAVRGELPEVRAASTASPALRQSPARLLTRSLAHSGGRAPRAAGGRLPSVRARYVGACVRRHGGLGHRVRGALTPCPAFAPAVGVPEGTHPSLWAPEDHSLRPRLPVDAVLMTDVYIPDREMIGHIVAHDAVAVEYYRTRCAPARGVHLPPRRFASPGAS